MPLPKFLVTGNLYDIPGLVVGGELVTKAISDQITFTCNLGVNDFLTWDGGLYRTPRPVVATVNTDGSISPVFLLANDPGLNVTGLQWKVSIGKMPSWWFFAENNGGTINLATVSRIPSAHVNAVVGVTMSEIIAEVQDPTSGLRIALEAVGAGWGSGGSGSVDGGTPSSPGPGSFDGGTP